jgi:hypothetical protein
VTLTVAMPAAAIDTVVGALRLLTALLLLTSSGFGAAFQFINASPQQTEEMRQTLEEASLRLARLLEVNLPETVKVVLVQTQDQFDSVSSGRLPEWGAAAAIPARDLIILRIPTLDQYPGSQANLLQHELAHIALHRRVNGRYLPRFLDEGFASWFAGEWHLNNVITIAGAQLTGSLLPLRRIDEVNAFHYGEANLAYSQSYLVVLYLFERFGEVGWLELLDAFAEGQSLNQSFRTALRLSFWEFESGYRGFLSDNYTIFAILSNTMGLWIVLAIVVVAGFILMKKRKKDAIDRWKEEEKLQSTDFDYDGSDSPWD